MIHNKVISFNKLFNDLKITMKFTREQLEHVVAELKVESPFTTKEVDKIKLALHKHLIRCHENASMLALAAIRKTKENPQDFTTTDLIELVVSQNKFVKKNSKRQNVLRQLKRLGILPIYRMYINNKPTPVYSYKDKDRALKSLSMDFFDEKEEI